MTTRPNPRLHRAPTIKLLSPRRLNKEERMGEEGEEVGRAGEPVAGEVERGGRRRLSSVSLSFKARHTHRG
jgi:hypothetical protein